MSIIEFPEIAKEKLLSYKQKQFDSEIDRKEFLITENSNGDKPKNVFRVPDGIIFYEYQDEAINKWIDSDAQGIFDMATGSGALQRKH